MKLAMIEVYRDVIHDEIKIYLRMPHITYVLSLEEALNLAREITLKTSAPELSTLVEKWRNKHE